ncbi:MAG: J domain-containing protein [Spirochaetes bacterium]|nr:J domain-containing protein [Spirochaetota bacterium]
MNIRECYKTLNVSPDASDEEISRAFKKLAMKYHPDKNRDRIEWANKIMSGINSAYSSIMSYRFTSKEPEFMKKYTDRDEYSKHRKQQEEFASELYRESLIQQFVSYREETKDNLYRYFQFNLNNLARREDVMNKSVFREIANSLKVNYHKISVLMQKTDDTELVEHFSVFSSMIFNFYKASECLNILDSYSNVVDVEAYKYYIAGEDMLHQSHKEIFYSRHNRGRFYQTDAHENALKSEHYFSQVLEKFPDSSWAIEADIKLNYVYSLLRYLKLFFSE